MKDLTPEEIKEVIRSARILAPQFTEDEFKRLTDLGEDLASMDIIKAAWIVKKLAQEYGIPCQDVPDKYRWLLQEVAKLNEHLNILQAEKSKQQQRLNETMAAIRTAETTLSDKKKELASFEIGAEKQKMRLRQEVEQARREAQVDKQDIIAAGKLKAEVMRHGLTLSPTLELLSNYKGDDGALKRLAEDTAEHESQIQARAAWQQQNETMKLEIDLTKQQFDSLKADHKCLDNIYQKLTANMDHEQELRGFYKRYQGSEAFIECLAGWQQIYLLHCQMCYCGAHFWVDRKQVITRAKFVCPCCGMNSIDWNHQAFEALNYPRRESFRLLLK